MGPGHDATSPEQVARAWMHDVGIHPLDELHADACLPKTFGSVTAQTSHRAG